MTEYGHITLDEREPIALFRVQGFGPCKIARELGRPAGQAIRIVQESFDEFFLNEKGIAVTPEISRPDWGTFKTKMIESVFCHNMHTRLFGLLRYIFSEYMAHCYKTGIDEINCTDDLPKYGYLAHRNFVAIWEIFLGLSRPDSE